SIENSVLASIGKFSLLFLKPLGFNWELATGLISGFIAKEASLSTLGAIYGASGNKLGEILLGNITPITAFTFIVFQLLYIPCAATVATIYKETRSIKWTLFSIFYSLSYAYIFTLFLNQVLSLFWR
ncbi:MAG: nucleoside recognition domain-containing protein, partial [Dictyoglomus sp.]